MGLFGFGKEKDGKTLNEGVQKAERPVSDTMIWICEKCGFKLADDENENPARQLQKNLKSLISNDKRKREVRAMVSSCLNLCPEGKMAAALADLKGGQIQFLEVDYEGKPGKAAEKIYRLL